MTASLVTNLQGKVALPSRRRRRTMFLESDSIKARRRHSGHNSHHFAPKRSWRLLVVLGSIKISSLAGR